MATAEEKGQIHNEVVSKNIKEDLLSFPDGFVWGTATASYQIEGAWDADGRGLSIWDVFSKKLGGDTGDIACDHYHRFEDDVKIMQDLGLKYYRFSISWPRIQPKGYGDINPEGISFYNRLINSLISHGIEPVVTLYHWDLPNDIQANYNGWLGTQVIDFFTKYARICFSSFGDRVKKWITLNEPWVSAVIGYGNGGHAPGVVSADGTKVYAAGHHLLLAHANAVAVYRSEFQQSQNGTIGITLNCNWSEPIIVRNNDVATRNNVDAAERILLWTVGWFAHPIWRGDYPQEMRSRCGIRLPAFTDAEKALVHGSSDFFGLNHYSTDMARDRTEGKFSSLLEAECKGGYFGDMGAEAKCHPLWKKTDMGWSVVPWGFQKLLIWCSDKYSPPGGIYVTENGCAAKDNDVSDAKRDTFRVSYLSSYIANMHKAIEAGADVRGYFVWSFMDNFEWTFGYSKRFGIIHVDYTSQERTKKQSAYFYSDVLKRNSLIMTSDASFMDAATELYEEF